MASRDVRFVEETLRSWRDGVGSKPASGEGIRDGDEDDVASEETRFVPTDEQRAKHPQSRRGRRKVIARYDDAMARLKSGDPAGAELEFEAIAREHPRHDYADNALYWKGEAAYDQRNFSGALAAFTAVVERYGGGNKAPDALLKIGLCYHNLGDAANARDVLTELIAAYPGARASDIARVKLAELGS